MMPESVTSATTFTYTDSHTGLANSSSGTATVNLNQTTAYIYGVGTTAGTDLFSNDLIKTTEYPDPITGIVSTSSFSLSIDRPDILVGLILGAAGGGILGNVIDGGRHRVGGTLIGGALGALLGKSIDQNSSDVRCR